MSRHWLYVVLAGAGVLWAAPAAQADSITVKALGPSDLGQSVSITHPNSGGAAVHYGGFAGLYSWEKTGGGGPFTVGTTFQTVCIELTENFSTGTTYTVNVVDPLNAPNPGLPVGQMTPAKAALLSELHGRFLGLIDTDKEAAAFQVAVWEIVYDTGLNLNANQGQVYIDNASHLTAGTYGALAQSWLNQLDGTGPQPDLLALSKTGFQDQIIVDPVPAPPALVLAGIGFLGLLGWRSRRQPVV
jgi:hypothetical protein